MQALPVYVIQCRKRMVVSFDFQAVGLSLSQLSFPFVFRVEIPSIGVPHPENGLKRTVRLYELVQVRG
jgi:hypothetical protein